MRISCLELLSGFLFLLRFGLCLPLVERFLQLLGGLVGLPLVVDCNLSLAFFGGSDDLGVVGIGSISVRASFLHVEPDVERGRFSRFVGDILKLDGLAFLIVTLLLFGELDTLPFADGFDFTVGGEPVESLLLALTVRSLSLFGLLGRSVKATLIGDKFHLLLSRRDLEHGLECLPVGKCDFLGELVTGFEYADFLGRQFRLTDFILLLSAKPYKSESNFLNGRSWAYFLSLTSPLSSFQELREAIPMLRRA